MAGFREKIGEAASNGLDRVADTWERIPRRTKIGAGGALGATGMVAGGFALFSDAPSRATYANYAEGKFDYTPGETLITDGAGNPAILSYLGESIRGEQPALTVSLASRLPRHFTGSSPEAAHLRTIQNKARSSWQEMHTRPVQDCTGSGENFSCTTRIETYFVTEYRHYSYPLEIEKDFRAVNAQQEREIRDYFKEFTRVTGIPVEVTWDKPDADITIANYWNKPDHVRGTLNYVNPNEIASVPPAAAGHGFASGRGFLILDERDHGNLRNLGNVVGKALGFTEHKADIASLRVALQQSGYPVPELAAGDTAYQLGGDLSHGSRLIPDNIIFDSGGDNTLIGTGDRDILLTEAGKCGFTDIPRSRFSSAFGKGDKYCIAEGEFQVVQAGGGNDFIIAAAGNHQVIDGGSGHNEIQFYEPEVGEKIILAAPEGKNNKNDLIIHQSVLERAMISAGQEGDEIVLTLTAASGRETGTIRFEAGAVHAVKIVGDQEKPLFEKDVRELVDAEAWQSDVAKPANKAVQDALYQHLDGQQEATVRRWQRRVRTTRENDLPGLEI